MCGYVRSHEKLKTKYLFFSEDILPPLVVEC